MIDNATLIYLLLAICFCTNVVIVGVEEIKDVAWLLLAVCFVEKIFCGRGRQPGRRQKPLDEGLSFWDALQHNALPRSLQHCVRPIADTDQ